jgi:hypothetical protein
MLIKVRALIAALVLVSTIAGCGDKVADPATSKKSQASGLLEAVKGLADAVSRNAPAQEIAILMEGVISNQIDAKAHPDEAKQIVEIYNAKLKGKLKGDAANQMKNLVEQLEKAK